MAYNKVFNSTFQKFHHIFKNYFIKVTNQTKILIYKETKFHNYGNLAVTKKKKKSNRFL